MQIKSSPGWSIQTCPSGDLVCLPKNELNQMVVKRTQEVIRLEQVAPVLRSVTVGFY
jgi:translation initiation factor 3 subunit K